MIDDLQTFHIRVAAGYPVRTATWNGRPHLVIPVIALRQGVIHAVNAETPEYVSADALERAAESWNGRSLVVGHPSRDGKQISASEPGVYDERGFGLIQSSRVKGRNLSMEAWVDPARLEALGQHAFLEDLRNGKQIEVSVGAHVRTLNKAGEYEGRKYKAEWGEIVGDHLAFLPGGRGACSLEMGCGAHRAASAVLEEKEPMSLREHVKSLMRTLRDIPQSKRDKLPESDFAGPDQSFPIVKPADVSAASHLIGKAAHPDAVKARIIAIAKRKGKAFVDQLPESWRAAAAYDTPSEQASEEAAELLKYQTMRDLLDHVNDAYKSASEMIDELIAAEEELPTMTPEDEAAEEEIECARMEAIMAQCMVISNSVMALQSMCWKEAQPEVSTSPRYMADGTELKTLYNPEGINQYSKGAASGSVKDHSEAHDAHAVAAAMHERASLAHLTGRKNAERLSQQAKTASAHAEKISSRTDNTRAQKFASQASHRSGQATKGAGKAASEKYGDKATATSNYHAKAANAHYTAQRLHGESAGMRGAAASETELETLAAKMEDCPTCKGSGNLNGNPCDACDGAGELKAAAVNTDGGESAEETYMTKEQRQETIKALAACECSGFKGDAATLETLSDVRLEALQAASQAREQANADLKAVQAEAATLKAAAASQTAAAPKPLTVEEFMAVAPVELKTLIESKKAEDAAAHASLVEQLKTAQSAMTEEELKAIDLPMLRKLAAVAKIDQPKADFSGQGLPRVLTQQPMDAAIPPNPYEAGLKALREQTKH